MKTLTVKELIKKLQKMPPDSKVRCWMPGSHISLSSVFTYGTEVRIEGNVDEGE